MMITRDRLFIYFFLGAVLIVYGAAFTVVNTSDFLRRPDIFSFAVTFDLTILVPALFYFFVVRRKRKPVIAIAPVFLLSLLAASYIVPAGHHDYLNMVELLLVPVELAALTYVVLKVRSAVRAYRGASHEIDIMERLRESIGSIAGRGRVADLVLFEIAIWYYAFFSWRARPFIPAGSVPFSYDRKNGYAGVMGALLGVLVVESVAAHILLELFVSPLVAWIATFLSLYGMVWVLGDMRGVRLRPILLHGRTLRITTGLRWSIDVPLEKIASIEHVRGEPAAMKGYINAAPLGSPKLLIGLKEPVIAIGPFGIRKSVEIIGVSVDEERKFMEEMTLK